jgi:protein TonB
LSGIVAVFESKTYDDVIDLNIARTQDNIDELVDIPQTIQPPPPPPVQQPKVIEVPEEEPIEEDMQLSLDVEAAEDTKIEEIIIKIEKDEEDYNQIFTIVEDIASPIGGTSAFYKYVSQNMRYPAQAKRMSVEGRVFCEFVVNRDGSIQDVKVLRGLGAGCDEEAIRVLQASPRWNPAKQRGKAVRSRFHMAIIFKLS